MPDVSDWSFAHSAPAQPTPPPSPAGVASAPPAPPDSGKPAAPGTKPAPPPLGTGQKPIHVPVESESASTKEPRKADRKRTLIRVGIAVGAALAVIGLLLAIYLVVSSSGASNGDLSGYSGTPTDYVPEQVGGRDVRTNAPALDEIGNRFMAARGIEGSNLELAAGMLPQGPRQPPQSVVLVLGGDGADGLMGSFQGDADVREDTTIDIDGVEVRLVRVEDDAFPEVWTAIASPREDVAVVAMSFSGGRRGAEEMTRAALERGKQ